MKKIRVTPNCPNRTVRFVWLYAALFLVLPLFSSAQTLDLQVGPSFSHVVSKTNGIAYPFLYTSTTRFSGFAGMEYWEHKYWSISSNLGYFTAGGGRPITYTDINGGNPRTISVTELFHFININSLFNFKYPIKKRWIPYISVGPKVDFLLDHNHALSFFDDVALYHKQTFGLTAAVGLKYAFRDFLLGIRAEHLYNFNCLAYEPYDEKQYINAGIISLTVGYHLGSHLSRHK